LVVALPYLFLSVLLFEEFLLKNTMPVFREEWAQLYRRDDPELGELRRRAILGNLRVSRFRSVCWRSLLAVLPPDTSQWLSQLRQQRQHYARVLKELSLDPWDRSQPEDNPLSQKAEVSLEGLCTLMGRIHYRNDTRNSHKCQLSNKIYEEISTTVEKEGISPHYQNFTINHSFL
jgi:hypothetical protein